MWFFFPLAQKRTFLRDLFPLAQKKNFCETFLGLWTTVALVPETLSSRLCTKIEVFSGWPWFVWFWNGLSGSGFWLRRFLWGGYSPVFERPLQIIASDPVAVPFLEDGCLQAQCDC